MNRGFAFKGIIASLFIGSLFVITATQLSAHGEDKREDDMAVHPTCEGASEAEAFPIAAGAWDKLESDHGVIVHPEVRSALMSELCTAALELHEDDQIDLSEIDARAPSVLSDYIERFLSQSRLGGRSLSAILTKEFGGLVMSIPRSRKFAVLSVTYHGDIDQLQIRQDTLAKTDRYIIPVGSSIVAGLKNDEIACLGMIKIHNNDRNKFDCVTNKSTAATGD